jgi:hypothetical protein
MDCVCHTFRNASDVLSTEDHQWDDVIHHIINHHPDVAERIIKNYDKVYGLNTIYPSNFISDDDLLSLFDTFATNHTKIYQLVQELEELKKKRDIL